MTYQIFPHKGEFAVCHIGWARPLIRSGQFESCWVVDEVAPSHEMAVEALHRRLKDDKVRQATYQADQRALARRR